MADRLISYCFHKVLLSNGRSIGGLSLLVKGYFDLLKIPFDTFFKSWYEKDTFEEWAAERR